MQRLIIQQIFCWIERDRRMSDYKRYDLQIGTYVILQNDRLL